MKGAINKMTQKTNRKNEHVSLAENFYKDAQPSFEDVSFVHHSFPQMNVDQVDLTTSLAGIHVSYPFFINAMSGGSTWTKKVNEKLATIARETNLPIATGSVSQALKEPKQKDSFEIVRHVNQNGLVIANLGAGHGLENAKKVVDILQADAMQIHINSAQELVMPEGDRNFDSWLKNIEEILNGLAVPLIVKEVGFGMSRETIQCLVNLGVKYIDVSGRGGTNFAQIENFRRKDYKLDDLEAWGQSTVVSLLEAQASVSPGEIIASGGVRKPIDIIKTLALGASITGLSGQFLHMALDDVGQTIETIQHWKEELRTLYTLLGARTTQELQKTDLILRGQTAEWCRARNINITDYAFRSSK